MTPAAELLHYALDASINMRRSLHHILLPEFTGAQPAASRRKEDCDSMLNALQSLACVDRVNASKLSCAILALTVIEYDVKVDALENLEKNLLGKTVDHLPRVSMLPVDVESLRAFKKADQGTAFRGVFDCLLKLPLPIVATVFSKDQLIALRDLAAFVNATGLREGNPSAEDLARDELPTTDH